MTRRSPGSPLLTPTEVAAIRTAVLDWYDREGRRLPFRGTTDPYLVLVSETILQQTQVTRGGPAWEAFVDRFPTVEALAAASPGDVLRAWRGLGYNRRALNLQRAARVVVDEFDGRFPSDVEDLERLPGVGPYTARAIASIAFGQPVGAVDTNVRRVLGRSIAGDAAGLSAAQLQLLADTLAGAGRPAIRAAVWTGALMDLGSTVCRPRTPRCPDCPIASMCRFASGADRPPDGLEGSTSPGADGGAARRRPVARERSSPFEQSRRWLRGRILDRLRDAPDLAWVALDGPVGDHTADAVAAAAVAMAGEGLVEIDPGGGSLRARLPTA